MSWPVTEERPTTDPRSANASRYAKVIGVCNLEDDCDLFSMVHVMKQFIHGLVRTELFRHLCLSIFVVLVVWQYNCESADSTNVDEDSTFRCEPFRYKSMYLQKDMIMYALYLTTTDSPSSGTKCEFEQLKRISNQSIWNRPLDYASRISRHCCPALDLSAADW